MSKKNTEFLSKVSKIFHISDIHIWKESKRYDEYVYVFNGLENILKNAPRGSIMVITGDILNNGSNVSSETYDLLRKLFDMSDIMPIILILENHDIIQKILDDSENN